MVDLQVNSSIKQILESYDLTTNPNLHSVLMEKIRFLCGNFLGGPWKSAIKENVEAKLLTGGMSNLLFLCTLQPQNGMSAGQPLRVLLRVYSTPKSETQLITESVVFSLLSARGLGPQLYGIFPGGRLEQFLPSRHLIDNEMADPAISRAIARKICRAHQIEAPIEKTPNFVMDSIDTWFEHVKRLVKPNFTVRIPENYHAYGAPAEVKLSDIAAEIEYLRSILTRCTSSPIVFCHNDLQKGNILLLDQGNENDEDNEADIDARVFLIDYEYAGYNFRGHDLANHFVEHLFDYEYEYPPYYTISLEQEASTETMSNFAAAYLEELTPDAGPAELHKEVLALVEEIKSFTPVPCFMWFVWCVMMAETSAVNFDYFAHGVDRLGWYYKMKHRLSGIQ